MTISPCRVNTMKKGLCSSPPVNISIKNPYLLVSASCFCLINSVVIFSSIVCLVYHDFGAFCNMVLISANLIFAAFANLIISCTYSCISTILSSPQIISWYFFV